MTTPNSQRWKDIPVESNFNDSPDEWLFQQAKAYGLTYLLAHADDGVIWGKVDDEKLALSGEAFSELDVKLDAETLQQARLFGSSGELLVWRADRGFRARWMDDSQISKDDILEERCWLWGTGMPDIQPNISGFTLMNEGEQGLRHAPPIGLVGEKDRVALVVRHYIDEDEAGQARIVLSRLVNLVTV